MAHYAKKLNHWTGNTLSPSVLVYRTKFDFVDTQNVGTFGCKRIEYTILTWWSTQMTSIQVETPLRKNYAGVG